jgi:nucleotide-binding universal stress UspA family protein
VTRTVEHDSPARALLARAAAAQLVVVGTRGRGSFRGLVLGSTSQQLLYRSPCPVAVVRADHT